MNFDPDSVRIGTDNLSADFTSEAQLKQIEEAWNQQDALKVARDLNALLQSMTQGSEAS